MTKSIQNCFPKSKSIYFLILKDPSDYQESINLGYCYEEEQAEKISEKINQALSCLRDKVCELEKLVTCSNPYDNFPKNSSRKEWLASKEYHEACEIWHKNWLSKKQEFFATSNLNLEQFNLPLSVRRIFQDRIEEFMNIPTYYFNFLNYNCSYSCNFLLENI